SESLEDTDVKYVAKTDFDYLRYNESQKVKIFISYAKEDVRYAEFLRCRFEEAGFTTWMDTYNILPGERWETAIERALKECHFFVACLSNNSVQKRGYVQREFSYALDKCREFLDEDIYIIPIRFDNCQIPQALSKFQCIDIPYFQENYAHSLEGGWGIHAGYNRGNSQAKQMTE
ncbi:MAG: hypothetical protein AMJ53_13190, partial [Gammaproteobacteria bacterium SG8_11]